MNSLVIDVLCGREVGPPTDPARTRALAALAVEDLARQTFRDAADERIVDFVRGVHQRTGADPHLLDAVLRGLLGAPAPALADPLAPLFVLGRGLVLALGLDEPAVTEAVTRAEQRLAASPPASAAPSGPATPSGPAPRSARTWWIVGGVVAGVAALALVAVLIFPLGGSTPVGSPTVAPTDAPTRSPAPPSTDPTVESPPPGSDPEQVVRSFTDAINEKKFDEASGLLCRQATSLTKHVAGGQLPTGPFDVQDVRTANSTTAYVVAKATLDPEAGPMVWRGTLRTSGGNWCLLDMRPEDDGPPAQPETREAAHVKMRSFVTLVNQRDATKAMSYTCSSRQGQVTMTMIDLAIQEQAKLSVTPDPNKDAKAPRYTGTITGQSRAGGVKGLVTANRQDDGTYCIGYLELHFQ